MLEQLHHRDELDSITGGKYARITQIRANDALGRFVLLGGIYCFDSIYLSIYRSSYTDDHRVTAGRAQSTLAFHSRMSRPASILMFDAILSAFFPAPVQERRWSAGFCAAFVWIAKYFINDASRHSIDKLGYGDDSRVSFCILSVETHEKMRINLHILPIIIRIRKRKARIFVIFKVLFLHTGSFVFMKTFFFFFFLMSYVYVYVCICTRIFLCAL